MTIEINILNREGDILERCDKNDEIWVYKRAANWNSKRSTTVFYYCDKKYDCFVTNNMLYNFKVYKKYNELLRKYCSTIDFGYLNNSTRHEIS